MKHLKKLHINKLFLSSLIALTGVITFPVALSSCNSNDASSYYNFICQRTFSLGIKDDTAPMSEENFGSATAWIFEKAGDTPYSYYAATCAHVEFAERNLFPEGSHYYCAFSDSFKDVITQDEFHQIDDSNIEWMDGSKNNYDFQHLGDFERDVGNTGTVDLLVDIAIVKIDFSDLVLGDSVMKKHLDYLDSLDKILNFDFTLPIEGELRKIKLYCAGLPKSYADSGEMSISWRMDNDYVNYAHQGLGTYASHNHSIDVTVDDDDLDDSMFYSNGMELFVGHGRLDLYHGSSGSLVIDQNYNVVGTYWGGEMDNYNDRFYGSVEVFQCNAVNYAVQPYDVLQSFHNKIGGQ